MSECLDADNPQCHTVALERFRIAALRYVSEELLRYFAITPEVDWYEHLRFVGDELVLQARQQVLGTTLERVVVEYPADWWQAFRQRWAPAWWLRRYPVCCTRRTVEVRALYPKLALPASEARAVLHVLEDVRPTTTCRYSV